MGPGFHSQVEAEFFGARHQHVIFLDQPQNCNFQELVVWAQNQIKSQYDKAGQKLTLLGHSFGSQIIAAALPAIGECVKEIRMMNSAYDSFDSFVALEMELFPQTAGTFDYWRTRSPEEKMILILKLASDPRFSSVYWQNTKARAAYELIAMTKPGLNISTFLKIFKEYLNHPKPSSQWEGPVKAFYSLQDSMIRNVEIVSAWKNIYPNLELIEIPECGHYLHFEDLPVADIFFGS